MDKKFYRLQNCELDTSTRRSRQLGLLQLAIFATIEVFAEGVHTFALELSREGRQDHLVPHGRRLRTPGDTGLDEILLLHPLRQPSHAAVAVERVGP